MDPATLAGLAVGALVRYLAAKGARLAGRAGGDVDRAIDQRLDRLYETVRARIVGDRSVEGTLHQLEADPADERQQGRLEYALENFLDSDRAFAATLAALLGGLADQHQGGVTVRDAGPVAFGGNVHQSGQYVAGRDLDVGRDRER
jgi:hypothetical protein